MEQKPIFVGIIILAGLVCYHNSINCGFVFDDISAIKDNKDLRPTTPLKNVFLNDFWGTPMRKEQSHKSYRPLCVLTFRWNYWMHELRPAGYHLVNMLLHIVVCLAYYRLCLKLLPETASFVAALLFAVHPIHTEAVTGVVGRAEILSSVFFLCAFMCYTKAASSSSPSSSSSSSSSPLSSSSSSTSSSSSSPTSSMNYAPTSTSSTSASTSLSYSSTTSSSSPSLFSAKKTEWCSLFYFVLCVASAMLCKEQGITVTGICVVYELFVVQKARPADLYKLIDDILGVKGSSYALTLIKKEAFKRILFLLITTGILLFGRLHIMGSQLPVFTRFDNPASVAPTPSRQLTYNYLVSLNLWLLLFPCDLCCDWTMGTIPIVENFNDIRNVATILAYLIISGIVWIAVTTSNQQHANIIVMGLALMTLPFLPASNLFFPVGFVIAERVLYMPSMGFCMLVAYGFYLLSKRFNKRIANFLLVILFLSHASKTYTRNWDWETEYSIFMSGLKVNQRNAKLFNNVGHALEGESRFGEALQYFRTAVDVQKDDVGAYINVGRTYNHLKMFKEAEEAYLKAKSLLPKAKPGESYQARIAPNHLNVFINLANLISKNHTRLEEADLLYRQAISMRADYTQAYINRGDILMKLNRTEQAQEVYERALLYDSGNPDIYYNLGVVFLEQGKTSQALAYLDKALEFDPEHEQALLNSAILLQELGGPEFGKVARERLLKLLEKDDKNERVYFNLGMLAMDEHNIEEAEQWFKRAVHLKQDFRSALFNLALLLADDKRPLEAAPFLNQLVKYHPNHVKGLILLGDIYINNIKDLDAAENCYKKILELEPTNIQGLHNLCVVYVERGKLAKAILCLEYAHAMSPEEDYILRHLQIVQTRFEKMKKTPDLPPKELNLIFSDYDPNEFHHLIGHLKKLPPKELNLHSNNIDQPEAKTNKNPQPHPRSTNS